MESATYTLNNKAGVRKEMVVHLVEMENSKMATSLIIYLPWVILFRVRCACVVKLHPQPLEHKSK